MFSNGMAVHLESFVVKNCTFKRLVRGFIREQGPNYKIWDHVLIEDNQFFDCGYYSNGAGGYPWIAGSGNNAILIYIRTLWFVETPFYDCPFPSFFSETKQSAWKGEGMGYNVGKLYFLVNWVLLVRQEIFSSLAVIFQMEVLLTPGEK